MKSLRAIGRAIVNVLLAPVWLAVFAWLSLVNLFTGRERDEE